MITSAGAAAAALVTGSARAAAAALATMATLVTAAALTGCGSQSRSAATTAAHPRPATTTARSRPATGLSVTPAAGAGETRFRFTFVAPAASGRRGSKQLDYVLGVAGPRARAGARCVWQRGVAVAVAAAGRPVTVAVGPRGIAGRWCPGRYEARVTELEGPYCPPGAMCPQFIRVVAILGRATFSVRRG